MASVCKHSAPTPRQASQRRTRLDELLDPDQFKALAEPTRLQLLSCLLKCGRPCSVSELAACCSVEYSTVARHLSTLARAGWVRCVKEGRVLWCAADAAALAGRFRALADAVEEAAGALPSGGGDGPASHAGASQPQDEGGQPS